MYEENRNQGFDGNERPDEHKVEESTPNFIIIGKCIIATKLSCSFVYCTSRPMKVDYSVPLAQS